MIILKIVKPIKSLWFVILGFKDKTEGYNVCGCSWFLKSMNPMHSAHLTEFPPPLSSCSVWWRGGRDRPEDAGSQQEERPRLDHAPVPTPPRLLGVVQVLHGQPQPGGSECNWFCINYLVYLSIKLLLFLLQKKKTEAAICTSSLHFKWFFYFHREKKLFWCCFKSFSFLQFRIWK